MNSSMMRGVRRGLMLLAGATIMTGLGSAAVAQAPSRPIVQPRDSGARLRDHLTTLADNPQSLEALIGAGRAALELGDASAALTFFGRADEISPRHAHVKAGMASALAHLGQPQAALSLFAEAVGVGAPEAQIAGDRGLAYDLLGYPRRAQQDYLVALRHREDPELRRRMALSLAISGERDAALRLIDPQLRRNDRAARRTQAFILALTGDIAGANHTAQATMPYGGAPAMAPFFARLATLNPSQKAMAVHLGQFPSGGPTRMTSGADVSADPAAVALAMAGAPPAAAATTTRPQTTRPQSAATRRRPETQQQSRRPDSSDRYGLRANTRVVRRPETAAAREPERQPTRVAEVNPRWSGSPYPAQPQGQTVTQPSAVPVQPPPSPAQSVAAQPLNTAPPTSSILTTTIPASQPAQRPDASLGGATAAATEAPTVPVTNGSPSTAEQQAPPSSFADIANVVNALPQEVQAQSSPPAAPERRAAPQRPAPAQGSTTRSQAAQPANPSRHWVQIAGGVDRASLPREFARLRSLAPEQLGRRTAFTAPMRTTSRLLVGPFASAREAQEFVNQLARHDVAAFAWTSAAGQEIERLAAR